MKFCYKRFCFACFICCNANLLIANPLCLDSGEGACAAQDMLYLLPNKDVYETCEDMWFKAWLFDRVQMSLSDRSATLYLRMYSPTDSIVWSEMYPIKGGRCDGHVYIGDSWQDGEYRIEGYTKSSFCNNGTTAVYPRKVMVVNRISQLDSLAASLAEADSLQGGFVLRVFPEGGDLIYGISSKVAFKATNGKGIPVDIEGEVLDNDVSLCPFKSMHDGMGTFTLTPQQGHRYVMRLKEGKQYDLADLLHSSTDGILQQGMSLNLIRQDKENARFLIRQSPDMPQQKVTLLAQMRGIPCCQASGMLSGELAISLPLRHFPYQGVVEVTLLDANMHPVAERLIYVHPQKKLNITAKTDSKIYYRRNEGKIRISVTDENGSPVQAELCLSLFDKWYQSDRVAETILSHCYLSEQIRGSIFNPRYYFDESNKDRRYALDLLLLTQGWRRYAWPSRGNEALADGIVGRELYGKKKLQGEHVGVQAIQVSGADATSHIIWTDSLGDFELSTALMEQLRSGYLYLKPLQSKEMKPLLEISDPWEPVSRIRPSNPTYTILGRKPQPIGDASFDISTGLGTHQLQGVTVTAKRRKSFTDKMTGKLDNLMQGKFAVGWVCKHRQGDEEYLNDYEDGYTHHPLGYEPDNSTIIKQPENGRKYKMIKYVQSAKTGDWYVKDIKHVEYKKENFSEEQLLALNNLWRTKGYYGYREFYQPDKAELLPNLPDARNALQWIPSVITDRHGNAEVTFLTSDDTGTFFGVIEGTDGVGLLGNGVFDIEIRKYAY